VRSARSHTVWLAANGPGPWPCTFCDEPVLRLGDPRIERAAAGIIHHHDHDHGNNAIGNLRAAHNGCHIRYHKSPSGKLGHLHVVDTLTARIEAGELKRGSKLPPERAIAKDLGVAFATVRRAMNVLRESGLILTVWGKGTFVRGEER
jgi:hypothetical protein